MADVRPFRAYRPAPGLEGRIAALPYDVYNRQEAEEIVAENPLSFLGIDRPEVWFGHEVPADAPQVYEKARELLHSEVNEGLFLQDEKESYYLYRQTMLGRTQTGIVACASIEDYQNQIIRKHENTRADKEEDRIRHVDTCNAHTGPIFLAYKSNPVLRQIIEVATAKKPVTDFTSEDGVRQEVWVLDQPEWMETIHSAFGQMKEIYIADGHHRCASAVKVGLKRKALAAHYTGEEPFAHFLAVLFSEDELQIMDYNRVVRDLNGMEKEAFLERISGDFLVEKKSCAVRPEKKGCFGMFLEGEWYLLTARDQIRSTDPVEGLDVSLLQNYLLAPILGIGDPRTDQRIDFVGGIRGLGELERRVTQGWSVAFSMYPTSIQELFAVADAGLLMPPKSTWFEPKLLSGLFLHFLD